MMKDDWRLYYEEECDFGADPELLWSIVCSFETPERLFSIAELACLTKNAGLSGILCRQLSTVWLKLQQMTDRWNDLGVELSKVTRDRDDLLSQERRSRVFDAGRLKRRCEVAEKKVSDLTKQLHDAERSRDRMRSRRTNGPLEEIAQEMIKIHGLQKVTDALWAANEREDI